ncbi:uncharacterized protein BN750_01620 [Bacteroides sp. CAG:661]|nr:uncharacterized protein BN750_01620 [Bacteroides sp. CAG:661]
MHQLFVGRNQNHISLFQTDIIGDSPLHEIRINIDHSDFTPTPHDTNTTQRADGRHTACPIEGMENGGKRRQTISAGDGHLAHHINLDGTNLSQCDTHLGLRIISRDSGIFSGQILTDPITRLSDGQPTQVDRTNLAYHNVAFGRNYLTDGSFIGSPNIDNHFITGSQTVIDRCGHVFIGFKSQ